MHSLYNDREIEKVGLFLNVYILSRLIGFGDPSTELSLGLGPPVPGL